MVMCAQHTKQLQWYCCDHAQLACETCALENHRLCKTLLKINERVGQIQLIAEQQIASLSGTAKNLENQREHVEELILQSAEEQQQASKKLDDWKPDIHSQASQLKRQWKESIQQSSAEFSQTAESSVKKIVETMEKVEELTEATSLMNHDGVPDPRKATLWQTVEYRFKVSTNTYTRSISLLTLHFRALTTTQKSWKMNPTRS